MTPHISPNLSDVGAQKATTQFKVTSDQWKILTEYAHRTKSRVVVGSSGVVIVEDTDAEGRKHSTVWTFDEIADMLQQMDGEESIADARALYTE